MQPHVKAYFKAFGYDESDEIMCEYTHCWGIAVDIHHVEFRSKFGSKRKDEQDSVTNLIALCRRHHDCAHGPESKIWKEKFKQIISKR